MKKAVAACLSFSLSTLAADFWQSKSFTEWSDKDVHRMVENSPWARPVSVSIGSEGPAAGRGGRSRRGGGDGMGEASNVGSIGPGGGDDPMAGPGGGGRNRGGGNDAAPGPVASTMLVIRWQTALPVKQALVKLKYGTEAGTSDEAKKILATEDSIYVIAVTGLDQGMLRGDMTAIKKALLEATSLSVKGKDEVKPTDLQVGRAGRTLELYFFFPRKAQFSADDKEIEFVTKLASIGIKQKFRTKEMMYNGKLAL